MMIKRIDWCRDHLREPPKEGNMLNKQKRALEALRRVQVFLDDHPDRLNTVNASGARTALNEVIAKLEALVAEQDPTRFQRRTEVQSERKTRTALREEAMRPIARIAFLELRHVPEFERLRMPNQSVDTSTLILWAREMVKAAELYAPTFLKHGLPQDFVAQFKAAVDTVRKSVDARWRAHNSRVGATAQVATETRRAVGIIGVVDALVLPKLSDDDQLTLYWTRTRRVASRTASAAAAEVPVGQGEPPTGAEPTPGVTPPTETSPVPTTSTEPVAVEAGASNGLTTPGSPKKAKVS
jgi:hypothetical protein